MLKLFTNKQKTLSAVLTVLALLFFQYDVIGQAVTVRGKVTDSKGEPLPGVSVVRKGEKAGTSTDTEGNFRLQVTPTTTSLVFSYVGFEKAEVNIKGKSTVNVTLKESMSQLNEVVVVAFGTQKKANVIGSVAQIKGDEIRQAPAMNITNALAGRLPGLTTLQQSGRPGADDATLRIRGVTSYASSQGPLIIVDGVQRPSFSNLDPTEIESISVLKDAVSTSVYGLQAANGIILITTKRGSTQKPTISYDGSVMVGQNTRFPKFLNGPDYMEWYNKATDVDNDYLMHTGTDPVAKVYSQEQIDALRNGTNTNPLLGNTDWVGELVGKTSLSQHHSVTVNGGTEKVKYFTSLGYLDQDGVVDKTGFKRYNVRSNIDAELSKVFSVSLNLGLRQQNTTTPGISPDDDAYLNPFYQAVRMLPNLPMYAPNGMPVGYRSNAGWINPIAVVQQSGYQNNEANVFQGNLAFNIRVPWVKGLTMKVLTAYDKTGTENKSWLTPYTLMGRDRDVTTGDFITINTLPGITRTTLRQSYNQNNRRTLQPSINYSNRFGDHSLEVLALYEWSQYKSNVFSAGASNFPLPGIHEIDFGGKGEKDVIASTGKADVDSRAGYVGRLNYGYKDKYLIEVAARYDASVKFPKENRWDVFPAVGLGWVISKEPFFKDNVSFVDNLKLKGSVGRSGNDRISGAFSYLQTYQLTKDPVVVIGGTPVAALYTSAPPNTAIKWETSTTTNVGFESLMFNGKLGVDFEWFYKVTNDILNPVGGLYPYSIGGYYPAFVNYGIVDNRGFDLQIRHNNAIGELKYGITGNLNWAKNKIIRRDENTSLPAWQRTVGRSVGEKIGFIVDGMYQNWDEASNGISPSAGVIAPGFFKYHDLNGDGRITRTDDMTYIGRSNMPQLMYGLNFDLKYRGFDFSALLQGAALCDVSLAGTYEGSSGTTGVDDNTPFTKTFYGYGNSPYFLVENAWTPDNPNAEFPRLSAYKAPLSAHNAHINSGWIRNGAYLRLKAVQFGYTIPKKVIGRAGIQQVRLYATGSNLFTWDHLKYLDPEMPNVNNGFYPQQRIYSFGVNLTF